MTGSELGDAVLLYLSEAEGERRPADRTVAAIAEALSLPAGSMSERVSLLSALSDLQSEEAIERTEQSLGDGAESQTVYALTEVGRERARERRHTLADRSITVDYGQHRVKRTLDAVEAVAGVSMPRAIVEQSEAGVLYVEDTSETRFVDRTAEREQLTEVLEALEAGHGGLVRIVGEAGVGKTTLVDDFVERASDRELVVCRATCQSEQTEPYRSIRDALEETIDLAAVHLFEASDEPFSTAEETDSFEAERRARFAAVADVLAEAAADTPIALVLDDSHHLDEPTLALLEQLVDALADAPVCVLLSHQPDRAPITADGRGGVEETVLDLSPLDRDAVRELVESLVGSRTVPEQCIDAIAERTGGNPLFVESSTNQLVENGFIDPRHDHYPTDPEAIPIPDAVETAIADQLEGLDDDGRRVLEAASVLGDECSLETLQSICSVPAHRIEEYVQLLTAAEIVTRTDDRISVRTTVVRETVLEALAADRKQTLHERAAATLSDVSDAPSASVAAHYERAGKTGPAIEQYRAAVKTARAQYAHELAIEYAETAVELARRTEASIDDDVVAELLSGIGEASALLGRHEAARKYYRYLEARTDDPQTRQESYYYRAKTHQDCGEYERACDLAAEGLAVDGAPDESQVVCRLLAVSGWSSRKQGDIEAALEIHERQRALAERLDDDGLIGRSLVSVGITHLRLGDLDAAMELFEQAVDRFERADDDRQLASVCNEIAGVHRRRGDIQAAKEAFERSLSLMRSVGYQVGVAKLLTNLGLAHDNLGNVDQALEYYEEAIEASDRLGDRQNVAVALCNSANLYRHRGDATKARQQFQRGLEINRDLQNDPHLIVFNLNLARVALQCDDFETAWEHTERAVALAEDVGYPDFHANALGLLGRLHRLEGDLDRAIEIHQDERELTAESETTRRKTFANVDLALDYAEADRPEEAREHAERAMAIAEETDEQLLGLRARYAQGIVCRVEDQAEEAIEHLQAARATARELQSAVDEIRVSCELIRAAAAADRATLAQETLQETRSRLEDADCRRLGRRLDELERDQLPARDQSTVE